MSKKMFFSSEFKKALRDTLMRAARYELLYGKLQSNCNIPLFRYFYNHLSNYTKTIIRLRLVNIPLDFFSGNIHQYSLRLRRIIVNYWMFFFTLKWWLAWLAPWLAWLALWPTWLAGSHISKTLHLQSVEHKVKLRKATDWELPKCGFECVAS